MIAIIAVVIAVILYFIFRTPKANNNLNYDLNRKDKIKIHSELSGEGLALCQRLNLSDTSKSIVTISLKKVSWSWSFCAFIADLFHFSGMSSNRLVQQHKWCSDSIGGDSNSSTYTSQQRCRRTSLTSRSGVNSHSQYAAKQSSHFISLQWSWENSHLTTSQANSAFWIWRTN